MTYLSKTLSVLKVITVRAIDLARCVRVPQNPKVFGSLIMAACLLYQQVKTGEVQSALMTAAGILAVLGIGGDVEKNAEHLKDIRNNPNMPGTPVPAPDYAETP